MFIYSSELTQCLYSRALTLLHCGKSSDRKRPTAAVCRYAALGRWGSLFVRSCSRSPQCCLSTRSAFDCCRAQWRTEQDSRVSTEDNNISTAWVPGVTWSAASCPRVRRWKRAPLCTNATQRVAAAVRWPSPGVVEFPSRAEKFHCWWWLPEDG